MVSQYSEEKDEKFKKKKEREREIKGRERNPTLKLQVFPRRKTLESEAIVRDNIEERKSGQIIFTSNKNIYL